jgi:L-asparagine transporter-like permease
MLSGHTKTHVVIAIAGIVAIAVRSTHIPRVVVPRATTQHPLRAHSTYAAPLACTAPLLRRQGAGSAIARRDARRQRAHVQ